MCVLHGSTSTARIRKERGLYRVLQESQGKRAMCMNSCRRWPPVYVRETNVMAALPQPPTWSPPDRFSISRIVYLWQVRVSSILRTDGYQEAVTLHILPVSFVTVHQKSRWNSMGDNFFPVFIPRPFSSFPLSSLVSSAFLSFVILSSFFSLISLVPEASLLQNMLLQKSNKKAAMCFNVYSEVRSHLNRAQANMKSWNCLVYV